MAALGVHMNTKFKYNMTDCWYIAASHGHSAFRLLQIAKGIESEYDALQAKLPHLQYGGSEYLAIIGQTNVLTKDMFKIMTASVAMFQAMMEAVINNALETEGALSIARDELTNTRGIWDKAPFKSKWEKSLQVLGKTTDNFDSYHDGVYKRFRIPLVHPTETAISHLDELDYPTVLPGYQKGWAAYQDLYSGLGKPHDESWEKMCELYSV